MRLRQCAPILLLAALACNGVAGTVAAPAVTPAATSAPRSTEAPTPTATPPAPPPTPPPPTATPVPGKWALWVGSTHLRGANIYQRRVYPELDGGALGSGPAGPPYTQADFNRLAAMGANYVNISHPGLFGETPPYSPDEKIQNNLDHLLDEIAKADMFAVISFRTGPGRSEFTFLRSEVGKWFGEKYLDDSVWTDQNAQEAWAAMWRYTAERYRDNPIVVGYDLMVEPNANDVWLNVYEPSEFYPAQAGTLYDWNALHPRITAAIREVDPDTPILIGAMSYSDISWLPYVTPTGDTRTVYAVHQYAPFQYTHQEPPLRLSYPGQVDLDGDGEPEQFDRGWLEDHLSAVDAFTATYHVPVAANEFGVERWEPGAAGFMRDTMDSFERRGMNYALWLWAGSWRGLARDDAFDFLHGPNPGRHSAVSSSDLIDAIVEHWGRNALRPSNFKQR
ncbi:MAG: cellulase family glycosylhydrolase [Chloroflexi bacterium]|nr:cellulase family glycosylhydrolase [Chloroflexota bacterium]